MISSFINPFFSGGSPVEGKDGKGLADWSSKRIMFSLRLGALIWLQTAVGP